MRKSLLVPSLLLSVVVAAGAQEGKVTGKLNCQKPDVNAAENAGDVAGHMLMLTKAKCTWPTPPVIAGNKTGATIDVAMGEMHAGKGTQHGYSSSVMDNGDTTVVRYEGPMVANKDGSATFSGTWRYVRGTGKFAGIEGHGTYKGKGAADGSATGDVDGHYTLGGARKGKTKTE